uniref:sensor histidine kinase n=1 Tax=Ezakiella massiliensis TaxID=1852374 RepID=UPI00094EA5EF|nr:ATP-binding protein [Ezakiella massiliensis]
MTLLDLNTYQLAILFIINTGLLVVAIKAVVEVAFIKARSKYFLQTVVILILSIFPIQVLAELGNGDFYLAKTFVDLSLYAFIAYDILLIVLEFIFAISFVKINRQTIGKNSVKKSMDNLPDGICFSKMDGTPLLVNRMMQDISFAVFGKMLANDLVCAKDIKNNNIKEGSKILQRDPLVIEAMGRTWQIKVIPHENVRETLAYDITLEWALYQQIQEKNKQIEKMNASLKDYQINVGKYTRQKEILQAKIKIHDKIGQSLIYFKRYLDMDVKTKEDRDKLISLWMESLVMLDEKSEDPDSAKSINKFKKLISTAKDIGVTVNVNGKLPAEDGDLNLLVKIVHESLNNAIRHGQAKNIWIDLDEDDINIHSRIKNDGIIIHGPIIEKGGLKNIRQIIESCGGKMKIQSDSHFILDLTWPKGGNHDL